MPANPLLASIYMFGGNFNPRGYAFCDGQLLSIAQNTALFSLLGTTYGGDGRTTFGLPDLRGRAVMHAGNGPGLSSRSIGQKVGTEHVILNSTNLPSHKHQIPVSPEDANGDDPDGGVLGVISEDLFASSSSANALYGSNTGSTGSQQQTDIRQPLLVINYIIATTGTFPSRT